MSESGENTKLFSASPFKLQFPQVNGPDDPKYDYLAKLGEWLDDVPNELASKPIDIQGIHSGSFDFETVGASNDPLYFKLQISNNGYNWHDIDASLFVPPLDDTPLRTGAPKFVLFNNITAKFIRVLFYNTNEYAYGGNVAFCDVTLSEL